MNAPTPNGPLHDTLVLFDAENTVEQRLGAIPDDYHDAFGRVVALGNITPLDHVVVSAHPGLTAAFFAMSEMWPTAQLRPRRGTDGADTALCDAVTDIAQIARSYRRVVIASGDHAFVSCVLALRAVGVATVVISHRDRASHDLIAACDEFIAITTPMVELPVTSPDADRQAFSPRSSSRTRHAAPVRARAQFRDRSSSSDSAPQHLPTAGSTR